MAGKTLWPVWTIVFRRTNVFCSGFRRIKKKKKAVQLSFLGKLILTKNVIYENAKMVSLFLMQNSKMKQCVAQAEQLWSQESQFWFLLLGEVLHWWQHAKYSVPNAVFLQHVQEVYKVSLLLQLCLLSPCRGSQHSTELLQRLHRLK